MPYKKDSITNDNIGELIRSMETNFVNGTTTQSKYVQLSMYEDLQRIDAYLNSKHMSGDKDSLDRDKPFFNIVVAAANIWYRATDIDRKNIKIRATKSKDTINALLATAHIQEWMRREKFGSFLNEWGRVLSRYGSAVTKFVEQDGKLIPTVIPWQRIICDAVDFDSNPKIELIELTEAQLYSRIETHGYDADMVDKLCDTRKARENTDGHDIDNNDNFIKLYEIHLFGEKSYLTGKAKDDDKYVQQMHVVSFVASKEKGMYDDFTLVSGQEAKDPYMITHLIKEDGQTLSMGAVKHLFDAQWMMNHTVKAIKDQLDTASKLIFQTSDGNFVGQNALSAIETGDILIHKINEPLTQVQNNSHDISALQNFGNMWKALSNEITGISESMLGNTAPAGTAWRQVEALLQQNQTLFELMTENKGLYIEDMFRTYVIPFIKKQLDTSEEVAATLSDFDITRIDQKYIKNSAIKKSNEKIIDLALSDQPVTPEVQANMIAQFSQDAQSSLGELGSTRFFAPDDNKITWKNQIKDMEWDPEVDVTGEPADVKSALETINSALAMVLNPAYATNPQAQFLMNKALTLAGSISPLELSSLPQPSPIQPQLAPQAQPAVGP